MGAIVLFDGICNFCNSSVNFVIERDPHGYFKFAPLQSDTGRELTAKFGIETAVTANGEDAGGDPIDSVILLEDGKVFTHSEAALRIAARLEGGWKWLGVLRIVPAAVRDAIYRLVARWRYRVFGKMDACMIPTPDVRSRFLS